MLGNEPSLDDNVTSRVLSGANTSTHDLMIDVGILSIGDDFAGIAQISCPTSSTDGCCSMSTGVPVNCTSAYNALVCLPASVDAIPSFIDRILLIKKSENDVQSFMFSPDVRMSVECVIRSAFRIADQRRRVSQPADCIR